MRIGSLFTGYGGLDMAVQSVLGGEVAWYSEIDKHACTVLAAHYPGVPNLGDVTRIDWTTVEPVDVLTGGYPCQPFSHAGQRKGTDDERHLWPFIADAIRSGVLRPGGIAVFENVDGHRSLGLADVLGDLACLGMSARWGVVRAADAGAPHGRKRVFIIAHAEGGRWGAGSGSAAVEAGRVIAGTGDGGGNAADTRGSGPQGCGIPPAAVHGAGSERTRADCRTQLSADSSGGRWHQDVKQPGDFSAQAHEGESGNPDRHRADGSAANSGRGQLAGSRATRNGLPIAAECGNGDVADADGGHDSPESEGHQQESEPPRTGSDDGSGATDWGKYGPAIRRWERVTRPAPDPTIAGPTGRPRLSPAFVEWMMGLPEGHVTGHGLKPTACLKMLGNGVVPQQAALALRLLGVGA